MSLPESAEPAPKPPSNLSVIIIVIVIAIPAVVALLGLLSALAIYGVRKHLIASKSAEARSTVMMIARSAASAYDREVTLPDGSMGHRLCSSASRSVPADAVSIRGRKYLAGASEWQVDAAANEGFACLGFSLAHPQYYMYSYESTGVGAVGDEFTARANGDLDGDGVLSTFELSGRVQPGDRVELSSTLTETSPLE
ncbi:MAG: hypothetical protein IT376_07175 [Polyangiaceae bacterium]|nr:hypothetical protein [Polyangiaceae bacterium]